LLSRAGNALNASGVLNVQVHVTAEGNAESISVFASPSEEMTNFAAKVLVEQKYKPARCGGKPCAMIFPFRLKFVK
jgi:outer membrane biosynthesis protein TonB